MKRWKATITYRTENGTTESAVEFEEFDELGEIIEQGPCWTVIVDIRVELQRAHMDDPDVPKTLEDEARQRARAGLHLKLQ